MPKPLEFQSFITKKIKLVLFLEVLNLKEYKKVHDWFNSYNDFKESKCLFYTINLVDRIITPTYKGKKSNQFITKTFIREKF